MHESKFEPPSCCERCVQGSCQPVCSRRVSTPALCISTTRCHSIHTPGQPGSTGAPAPALAAALCRSTQAHLAHPAKAQQHRQRHQLAVRAASTGDAAPDLPHSTQQHADTPAAPVHAASAAALVDDNSDGLNSESAHIDDLTADDNVILLLGSEDEEDEGEGPAARADDFAAAMAAARQELLSSSSSGSSEDEEWDGSEDWDTPHSEVGGDIGVWD